MRICSGGTENANFILSNTKQAPIGNTVFSVTCVFNTVSGSVGFSHILKH